VREKLLALASPFSKCRRFRAAALVIAAGLTGCVSATPTTLPDGTAGQIIRCNGRYSSIADCYQKAGETCPAGYDIVGGAAEAQPFAVASGGTFAAGATASRSMLVHCR
jgi:hypothetical protein